MILPESNKVMCR